MIVRRTRRLPSTRNVVVLLPSGATLLNLFFGIFAMVQASRAQFGQAALFVVLGGVADMLDGRIARATGTGTRFGEELDSLVDAITFGLAPAMIMYFAVLNQTGWDWIWVFVYCAAAVTRLARFNVEQAGRPKTHFHGLPSPAAGMTLATYIWFGQTNLYNDTILFLGDNKALADLPWHTLMRFLMGLLAALMVSNVPYPSVPSIGMRSTRQIMGSVIVIGSLFLVIFLPREFFFPALMAYIAFGIVQWAVLGVLDRPATPTIFLEEEPDGDADADAEDGTPDDVALAERASRVERAERHSRPPRGEGGEHDRGGRAARTPRAERERSPDRESRPPREAREPRPDRAERDVRPMHEDGAGDESAEALARRKRRRRRGRADRADRGERQDRTERPESPAPSPESAAQPSPPQRQEMDE